VALLLCFALCSCRLITNTGCNKFEVASHAREDELFERGFFYLKAFIYFVDHKILGNLGSYVYTQFKVGDFISVI